MNVRQPIPLRPDCYARPRATTYMERAVFAHASHAASNPQTRSAEHVARQRWNWRTPLAMSTSSGVSLTLDDAVDDEVHRVLTGHVLLAKEPYGGAFCLGEYGHEHIGPGNLLAAGPLDVGHGTLNDPLKGRGRCGAVGVRRYPKLVIDVIGEVLFERARIDVAGLHHC